MDLLVMRHGRTDNNEAGIIDGQGTNGKENTGLLTMEGAQEVAEAAAELVLDYPTLDTIYSSDLPRAVETAEIVREVYGKNIPIETSEALCEIDMGEHEGKAMPPVLISNFFAKLTFGTDLKLPGVRESWMDVHDRVMPFINKIYRRQRGKGAVLIVTHSLPMQTIGLETTGELQVNIGVNTVENAQVWRLLMDGPVFLDTESLSGTK